MQDSGDVSGKGLENEGSPADVLSQLAEQSSPCSHPVTLLSKSWVGDKDSDNPIFKEWQESGRGWEGSECPTEERSAPLHTHIAWVPGLGEHMAT